ncbi:hypothetical protein HGRIS_006581 [Hohenbuehelia grisea]|uniref:Rap-GAP domain-containing protein n=1 Tax=Hohenbuehelia grisea TaxID=104357 RepID=A0ABR3J9D0_9AGAR
MSRPRSSTKSFNPPWNWKNNNKSPPPPPPKLDINELLEALSPPNVPSPQRARDLANALHAQHTLPQPSSIASLLFHLCSQDVPSALQAAGFDILAAYAENTDAPPFHTSDRLAFFQLFAQPEPEWTSDLWEPRLKALRALTKDGKDIAGFEPLLLPVLKAWISAAFHPLLAQTRIPDINERLDRERSIDVFAHFIAAVLDHNDSAALVTDASFADLLLFYQHLVHRALNIPLAAASPYPHSPIVETSPRTHRRGQSSASLPSLPSPTIPGVPYTPAFSKHPADVACSIYLDYFLKRAATLAPQALDSVLPLLFRAHAFYASALPRLAANPLPPAHTPGVDATMEERITSALAQLLGGPYASTCAVILRRQLLPSTPSSDSENLHPLFPALQTALGALRTLRTQIRAALIQRLMRAYAPEDTNPLAHAHNKRVPPVDTGIARDVPTVARAVQGWTAVQPVPEDPGGGEPIIPIDHVVWAPLERAKERFMEEAAGLLRDVFQERDARADNEAAFDDDEAAAVGQTLYELAGYILSCRAPPGYAITLPLAQPHDAPTPFLRTLSALLAREHAPSYLDSASPSTSTPTASPDADSSMHRRTTNLIPRLSTTLLRLAPRLADADTARLPPALLTQCALVPGDPEWLANWDVLLDAPALCGVANTRYEGDVFPRPLTRAAVMNALREVHSDLRDMPRFRRPLVESVLRFARVDFAVCYSNEDTDGGVGDDGAWQILADEVVLRTQEGDHGDVAEYLDLLFQVARSDDSHIAHAEVFAPRHDLADADSVDTATLETPTPLPLPPSNTVSPILSRMQSEYQSLSRERDKDSAKSPLPSVMSLLTSLAGSATSSRSPSVSLAGAAQALHHHHTPEGAPPPVAQYPAFVPRSVTATAALVSAFHQLAFMLPALAPGTDGLASAPPETRAALALAFTIYDRLLNEVLAANAGADPRARIAVLQFFMRVRADRDHRLEFDSGPEYDREGLIKMLAGLIGRAELSESEVGSGGLSARRSRARTQERDLGRRASSRGRGNAPSSVGASRSQSRVPPPSTSTVRGTRPVLGAGAVWPAAPETLAYDTPAWRIPEMLPFALAKLPAMPSEALVSYDPDGPDGARPVLQISQYLDMLVEILETEADWDVLAYVLCHLPTQLANKHLFCGPQCRATITRLALLLARGILTADSAAGIGGAIPPSRWPPGLKARDAKGLAFHALSVLVSYRQCFDTATRHLLVEVFHSGLDSGQPATIKCCLHALALAAFELPSSLTKCLSRVLQKLAQIMSNPRMAVHILAFLSIIGSDSCRALHANFTEAEYKMIFGVALQYLQHHNRIRARAREREAMASAEEEPRVEDDEVDSGLGMSWALSQHVRILSYYVVYLWFLALRLEDRPRHVSYITRQLLIANEGCVDVDEPTEVAFDWLARYTYASADPRPTRSLLGDLVVNPTRRDKSNTDNSSDEVVGGSSNRDQSQPAISEKTWLVGNAVLTVRTLERRGWIEVLTRRPSGFTKLLCRVENVPMVGPGDVDPDFISVAAGIMMDRDPPRPESSQDENVTPTNPQGTQTLDVLPTPDEVEDPPRPDPITGYVWSGSAPSQRRKEVSIDPSFLPLQLSAYPDRRNPQETRQMVPPAMLSKFFTNLDRIPVIDTHKVGILYVSPGQTNESDILRNTHGSPAYTRFLEGLGRLIDLRGQVDVYAGGLNPDEDGAYAYAWWDDIGQILYHTATMMPSDPNDPQLINKKRHIGNDFVRIVWNDSGLPYRFDTLSTQFQFANIVIEPHSVGAIAAFSNNKHENEYFKLTVQRAPGMPEFVPVSHFKIISAESLPLLVRQLSLLADWFASVFERTQNDTARVEMRTNWHARLDVIRRLRAQLPAPEMPEDPGQGILSQEVYRDFTTTL